jgi:hypothetical protein
MNASKTKWFLHVGSFIEHVTKCALYDAAALHLRWAQATKVLHTRFIFNHKMRSIRRSIRRCHSALEMSASKTKRFLHVKSYMLNLLLNMSRVGQNHIYTVYIRYFWQGNHQIYGHIRCIYTVLANPKHVTKCTLYDAAALHLRWTQAYRVLHSQIIISSMSWNAINATLLLRIWNEHEQTMGCLKKKLTAGYFI